MARNWIRFYLFKWKKREQKGSHSQVDAAERNYQRFNHIAGALRENIKDMSMLSEFYFDGIVFNSQLACSRFALVGGYVRLIFLSVHFGDSECVQYFGPFNITYEMLSIVKC